MSTVVGVCIDDAVGSRVVTRGVHSIRAGLVEGGLHIMISNRISEQVCSGIDIPETSRPAL